MTGCWREAAQFTLLMIIIAAGVKADALWGPEKQMAMQSSEKSPQGKKPAEDAPHGARRVPGGWKLPGDDTVYPYNPLVPPDRTKPVPKPPSQRTPR